MQKSYQPQFIFNSLLKIIISFFIFYITTSSAFLGFGSKQKTIPLPNFTPALTVVKQWQQTVGNGTGGRYLTLRPVVANGIIYAGSHNGKIIAFNSSSGKQLWQVDTHAPLASALAIAQNKLFVGTSDAQIIALNLNNGSKAWSSSVSNEVLTTPYIAGNVVLVNSEDGKLSAFDTHSGKQLWTFQQPNPDLIIRSGNAVAAADGFAVAGFANGQMAVLSLTDGALLWQNQIAVPQGGSDIQRMVDIGRGVQVSNGVIYVATYQGQIAAILLHTGEMLWHRSISSYAGLTLGPNAVYVADSDGGVWAFNRSSGNPIWHQTELQGRSLTGVQLMGKAIVVGDTEGYLHLLAINDGHFLARVQVDKKGLLARPVAQGNQLYVYTDSGKLVMYQVG